MTAETRRAASLYRRFRVLARELRDLTRMRCVCDRYNEIARTIPADQSALLIAHNNACDRLFRKRYGL